jgi:hypothetical protein
MHAGHLASLNEFLSAYMWIVPDTDDTITDTLPKFGVGQNFNQDIANHKAIFLSHYNGSVFVIRRKLHPKRRPLSRLDCFYNEYHHSIIFL